MQIVIDIPKSLYANLQKIQNGSIAAKRILECVRNGIPLPKGHGRLIDADAVEKEMNKSEVEADRNADYYTADKIDCAMEYIINAETIIEADGGDTETWNGYHGQVTAPKGTFKRIYEDADGGDAE